MDNFTLDSIHYWSFDKVGDPKDLHGRPWGILKGKGNSDVEGVHRSAYNINASSGSMTLLKASDSPYPCLVNPSNCSNGLTISLWLKHRNVIDAFYSGQIFLRSGNGFRNQTGFMLYQVNSSFDHLALQVNKPTSRCTYIFSAPEKVWSHYVIVWDSELKLYRNGEIVSAYLHQECESHVSKVEPQLILGDWEFNRHVSFDEVTIWNRSLSGSEVKKIFKFYKGTSCS